MRLNFVLISCVLLAGCSSALSNIPPEAFSPDATIAATTRTQELLQSLPVPKTRIVVAVYEFPDETGQHKPSELAQYSRAVTQGGLSLLKKALIDAGRQTWFRVLERGGLNHILREREIIRAVRAQFAASDGTKLPDVGPLLYSGLLLEGGIIAYESNVLTGGLGARYLGIGGSSEYRRDMVTVALRAVNVTSGEVLLAASTPKTIYSHGLQGGVFKYVSFDKLLKSEAGYTANEPPQLAVRQAIEMAVYSLVMEGSKLGIWSFKDRAAGKRAYESYLDLTKRSAAANLPSASPSGSDATSPEGKEGGKEEGQSAEELSYKPEVRPETKAMTNSKPSASLEDVSPGYYFQVASVPRDAKGIEALTAGFQKAGLPVALQLALVEGSTYCRILIGPYVNLNAALQQRTHIDRVAAACLGAEHGKAFLKRFTH